MQNKKRSLAIVLAFLMAVLGFAAPAAATSPDLTECVPIEAKDAVTHEESVFKKVHRTDWLREAPDGEGWEVFDEREVPATYEWEYTRQAPNPDYVAPWTETFTDWFVWGEQPEGSTWTGEKEWVETSPAVDEVAYWVYTYKKWKGGIFNGHWEYKDFPESAKPDPHSGWIFVKKTWHVETEGKDAEGYWLKEFTWTVDYPAEGDEFITETAWGERGTFSREWTETGKKREKDAAYTEYRYKKVERTDWVHEDNYAEYEGWKVVNTRTVTDEPAVEAKECPPNPGPKEAFDGGLDWDCDTAEWIFIDTYFYWAPIWNAETWEYTYSEDPTRTVGPTETRESMSEEDFAALCEEPVTPPVDPPTPPVTPEEPPVTPVVNPVVEKPAPAPQTAENLAQTDQFDMGGLVKFSLGAFVLGLLVLGGTALARLRTARVEK